MPEEMKWQWAPLPPVSSSKHVQNPEGNHLDDLSQRPKKHPYTQRQVHKGTQENFPYWKIMINTEHNVLIYFFKWNMFYEMIL